MTAGVPERNSNPGNPSLFIVISHYGLSPVPDHLDVGIALEMGVINYKVNSFVQNMCILWGLRKRSWFRHYGTYRKVAGSIPDSVIGIFH
jgi:hypothetical protein